MIEFLQANWLGVVIVAGAAVAMLAGYFKGGATTPANPVAPPPVVDPASPAVQKQTVTVVFDMGNPSDVDAFHVVKELMGGNAKKATELIALTTKPSA